MEEAISMASKYLDMCPPVLASLKAGTPIIAIETGFFMQLPYPRNLEALQECEQAFYRRDCVPCCVGIVNGRLKAGLSKQDMDTLCRSGGSCTRSQIPALVGGGSTSGTGPSATLACRFPENTIPQSAPLTAPFAQGGLFSINYHSVKAQKMQYRGKFPGCSCICHNSTL